MFRRRTHARAALSVCCVTDQPPEQTAAVLAPLRPVAREFVIGLDRRLEPQRRAFERIADRVVLVDPGPIEGNIAAVHAACSHDWVLRVDADEVVSAALVRALPSLVGTDAARQYAFTRRWLTADADAWLDERPWWPDFQVRLVRRSTAKFSAEVHAPVELDAPRLFVDAPIYHANAVLLTPAERQRKVLEYEVVHLGGPRTLREDTVAVYEPERRVGVATAPVPAEDERAIASLLAAADRPQPDRPRTLRKQDADGSVAATWLHARAAGTEAAFRVAERDLRLTTGEPRSVLVHVANTSPDAWRAGQAVGAPGVVLGTAWLLADGARADGPRSLLPADLPAGEELLVPIDLGGVPAGASELHLGVVDEGVRWLDGELVLPVDPSPARTLPNERRVPLSSATAEIPRVIHRVWLGDRPLPANYRAFGETWAEHHPGWELRLWTDDDAPQIPGIEAARNLAERSDLVRYEILRQHGGVYVDTDVECLRPIDDLLTGVVAFSSYEVPGRLCNAVMGGVPGHPALERLAELSRVTVGHGHYPEATATTFSTFVLERFDDVTLFPASVFYPELWDGRENRAAEAPYTRHHWAKGWAPTPLAEAPRS